MTNQAQETKAGLRAVAGKSSAVGAPGNPVVAGGGDQGPYSALWIANAGTVEVRMIDGTDHVLFKNVPAGGFLSIMVDRVYACPADTVGVI